MDSIPGPRLIAPMLQPLSNGVCWKILNINPYELWNLQLIPPLSCHNMDHDRHVLLTVLSMNVHSWFYFIIVIYHICTSLFQSPLLNFCKHQSKLDPIALRQGSIKKKFTTEQAKNMILARIRTQVHGFSRRCSNHWDTVSFGRSWFLILMSFQIFNSFRRFLCYIWTLIDKLC